MRRFAVIGLGRFGMTLATELAKAGCEVIAVDLARELVEAIADTVSHAVILDATDEKALASQGVPGVDCAVVAIGENFEANVLATINCKNFGIKHVVARGATHNQLKILERIGADLVLQPEESSARRLSHQLITPNMRSYEELVEGVAVSMIEAPRVFHHRTLASIHLRQNHGLNLVAIRRRSLSQTAAEQIIYPRADTEILPDDLLVLVGSEDDLNTLATGGASG
jgi:trk system potassium uptake protein TrkA